MEYAASEVEGSWCFPSFCKKDKLTTLLVTERYRSSSTLGLGRLKTGGVTMVLLKVKKACSHVPSYRNG